MGIVTSCGLFVHEVLRWQDVPRQKIRIAYSSPNMDLRTGMHLAKGCDGEYRNNAAVNHDIFAQSCLQEGLGRPIDIQPAANGSLLVFNDLAEVVEVHILQHKSCCS